MSKNVGVQESRFSALSFLGTGSNIVVVGAGGAGKTETILLAMENTRKSKADTNSC